MNARSHEVVAILARHIAAAADTAPVDADDTSIVDVALDAAHADLVTLLGREAADRVVSAEHVVGSIFYAGVCEHLLAFHRAHGGRAATDAYADLADPGDRARDDRSGGITTWPGEV